MSAAVDRLRSFSKWLTSYLKNEWTAADYPLRWSGPDDAAEPRVHLTDMAGVELPLAPWSVAIVDWPLMSGSGQSRREALAALNASLARYETEEGPLPRPGTAQPLKFAGDERIEAHRAIVDRILIGALTFPPEDVWVSDGSSLSDFAVEDGVEVAELQARIGRMYDVDISHIEDGNLAAIAEHIAEHSPRV